MNFPKLSDEKHIPTQNKRRACSDDLFFLKKLKIRKKSFKNDRTKTHLTILSIDGNMLRPIDYLLLTCIH